jgi:hypothetical protein
MRDVEFSDKLPQKIREGKWESLYSAQNKFNNVALWIYTRVCEAPGTISRLKVRFLTLLRSPPRWMLK